MAHDHLTTALAAATARAWPEALRGLLAVWRDTRSPVVATALEQVSARAAALVPVPIAQTSGTHNVIWLNRAKEGDPVVIGQLCATLQTTRRSNDLLRRIELLLTHGPDPRIAMAVCDVLTKTTYPVLQPELRVFWARLFGWLPELGDPRVLSRTREFANAWAGRPELDRRALTARLDDTMDPLTSAYREHEPLDAAARDICLAITEATRTIGADRDPSVEAMLLAAIYAAPDDDAPRAIYADWLIEHDDPRGELIALQLAKPHTPPTPAAAARERAFLHTFGATWTAPLARAELARGFLAESLDSELLGTDPRLATLVCARSVPEADGLDLPALRTLDKLDHSHILHLATLTTPLVVEHLGWTTYLSSRSHPAPEARIHDEVEAHLEEAVTAFAQIRVLAQLRSFAMQNVYAFELADIERVLAAPCMRALGSFALFHPLTDLAALIEAFTRYPFETIVITADGRLDHQAVTTLERDVRGRFGRLELSLRHEATAGYELANALASLPPDQLTRLAIVTTELHPDQTYQLRDRFEHARVSQTALVDYAFSELPSSFIT